jgi:hypothetical protein
MAKISTDTVVNLADVQGHANLTGEFAERIAAGADNALAAVRASVTATLFDSEPAQFARALEELAGSEDDG